MFCEDLRAKGYAWGPQTDEARKTHSALKPYAELPEEEKEQNRGFVRDIPNKLARAGYVMLPARSHEPPSPSLALTSSAWPKWSTSAGCRPSSRRVGAGAKKPTRSEGTPRSAAVAAALRGGASARRR